MIWILGIGFVVLLLMGAPIAFALAIPALVYLVAAGHPPLAAIAQQAFTATDSFPLLAIPFFLLAGELMTRAHLTERIVRFSESLVGWIRGGLGHTTVLASMLFSGISGSGVADSIAIGKVMIPAMDKAGYDRRDASALTAASAVIGPIIPPSIPMIILGSAMNVSIGGLFAAGLIPGVLFGLGLMGASWYANRNNPNLVSRRFLIAAVFRTAFHAIIPLLLPVILLGGMLSGVFTATEAGAVAVLYATIVGLLVLRTLSFKELWEALIETAKGTAVIMLIIAAANPFSWLLSINQVPQTVASTLIAMSDNPLVILLIINLILLIAGMFMETTANILILSPILMPAAIAVGLEPLHIAILIVVNLSIGLITPPVGLCLFSTSYVARLPFESIVRRIWPYLFVELVVLALISVFPTLTMIVPELVGLR